MSPPTVTLWVECDNMIWADSRPSSSSWSCPVPPWYFRRQKCPRHRQGGCPDYTKYQAGEYPLCRLQKNGLTLDQQKRNPSRLSRDAWHPARQSAADPLETNIGKSCRDEWRDWLEAENLPETESLADDSGRPAAAGRCPHSRCCARATRSCRRHELCPRLSYASLWPRAAVAGWVLHRAKCCTSTWTGILPAPLQRCIHSPRLIRRTI